MAHRSLYPYILASAMLFVSALTLSVAPVHAQGLFGLGGSSSTQPQPAPAKPKAHKPKPPAGATAQTPTTTGATKRPATATITVNEWTKRKANENAIAILGSGRQVSDTQFAEEISTVVERASEGELRVMPVLGKGATQNVLDMLGNKGMDMGIVDQDVLSQLKQKDPKLYADIDKRIHYVAKLFNTELQIYAKSDVKSLEDLKGKKISCLKEGSTVALLCQNLFNTLNIDAEIVYDDADHARQKVIKGEVAAAANPPLPSSDKIKPEDGLHFVPVNEENLPNSDFAKIRSMYLPARLKHEDHPTMIPPGSEVPTIATSSLLAVYAWPAGSPRYLLLQKFVRTFFDHTDDLLQPPNHPKWADVNLAAEVQGWTRFQPAKEWLETKRKTTPVQTSDPDDAKMKVAFDTFMEEFTKKTGGVTTEEQKEALYDQFKQWWKTAQKPPQ